MTGSLLTLSRTPSRHRKPKAKEPKSSAIVFNDHQTS
uniref:Uncharacterized protein n=1 Tax=Setaria italica TaxID=4555 RepID=K3ZGS9_SETIT